MSRAAGPDPEQLLVLARAGSGHALGQLLELYRSYLTLLARLQISTVPGPAFFSAISTASFRIALMCARFMGWSPPVRSP